MQAKNNEHEISMGAAMPEAYPESAKTPSPKTMNTANKHKNHAIQLHNRVSNKSRGPRMATRGVYCDMGHFGAYAGFLI